MKLSLLIIRNFLRACGLIKNPPMEATPKKSTILFKIRELEQIMENQQFLYGSLQSIKQYMLVHTPMEAAQYLSEFTHLLKTLSSHSKQKDITLAQEIDSIFLYLELEKKRLGKELTFYKNVDWTLPTEKIKVKPLFAFKEIEKLVDTEPIKPKQISIIVRKLGNKIACVVEESKTHASVIINIPN